MILKIKATLFLVALLAICFSCKMPMEASSTSSTTLTKSFDGKTMFIQKESIYQKPQVAELDVKKQRVKMVKTYEKTDESAAKELAKGDFMVQEKCDVIVEPYLFTSTETNESGSNTTVTITGYPAFYINIKNYEKKDSVFFTLPNYVN